MEGRSVGQEEGREEGRDTHLIKQVTKKLSMGYTPDAIAEDLMESLENVKEICAIVAKHAPDYDVKKIFDELRKFKCSQPV